MTRLVAGDLLLGRYRLEVPLGRGGAGSVWRAKDTRLGRPVAIKALPKRVRSTAAVVAEARTVAGLSSPHIVQLYELAEDDTTYYLVTEIVDGATLETVAAGGSLDAQDAAAVLAPIASALAAAHGVGVVHGDVKPANVLLGRGGEVKLADFGSAAYAMTQGRRDRTVEASPAFAAPEVLAGRTPTMASDLYSLGATLARVIGAKGAGSPLPRDVPGIMRTLIAHLSAEDPRDRPGSAEEVIDDLELIGAEVDRRALVRHLADAHAVAEAAQGEALAQPREPLWTADLVGRLWPALVLGVAAQYGVLLLLVSMPWSLVAGVAAAMAAFFWPWAAGIPVLLIVAAGLLRALPFPARWAAVGLIGAFVAPLWMLAGRRYAREILAPVLVVALADLIGAPLVAAAALARTLTLRWAVIGSLVGTVVVAFMSRWVFPVPGWPLPRAVELALVPVFAAALSLVAARGPRWLGLVAVGALTVAGFAALTAFSGPRIGAGSPAFADLSLFLIIGAAIMAAAAAPRDRDPERR